ncbi:MAG: glycosyltransferase family 2 protein [Draconibacterium sp.]|nr:glycosyltransferase family 2 protein [Draconibacterium sp.]
MISVVIPLLNESNLVSQLIEEVFENLQSTGEAFEIVCVDDGSTDSTLQILLDFRSQNKQLKIISFSRNFGLQAAITAGLDFATGDYVIMMDGDFQDPPELIPVLFNKITVSNSDIVTAVRDQRNEKLSRRIFTNIFHRIFSQISEEHQVTKAGNFCILNKKAHQAILRFSEKNRYMPGIRNFVGFKHEFIEFDRPRPIKRQSKNEFRETFYTGFRCNLFLFEMAHKSMFICGFAWNIHFSGCYNLHFRFENYGFCTNRLVVNVFGSQFFWFGAINFPWTDRRIYLFNI